MYMYMYIVHVHCTYMLYCSSIWNQIRKEIIRQVFSCSISLLFLRSVSSFNTSTFSVCVLFLYFSVVSHRNTNAAKSKPIHKQNSRNQSDPWSMLNKFKRCTLSAYQNYISMSSLSFQWTATTTTKLLKINLLKDYANGLLWWPRARWTREFCFIKMLPQNVYLPRLRLCRTSVWA